ncbi:SMI1/KNR4 family protein [Myxococcus sp. MISCRS1]|uniref:SMI1/KNR4 family protein n=1 Tax=Myxococcus sp. MISCRS1 TaxID=2996786 RepID=UPI00226E9952|nr:SMI1/KNR4 family protein [Myxococcus sp. MISCRS1]MCY1002367.1 SMI1/KNR4 family protein [Myxococcus sp. MISCRS1]
MSTQSNESAVTQAVERLKSFVETKDGMSVEFAAPVDAAAVAGLEAKYKLKLPPSYVRFITTLGTFKVVYGGQELIGMEEPGLLRAAAPDPSDAVDGEDAEVAEAINQALFFQRRDDDSVENFWCFNPRARSPEGELAVVAYSHDEAFSLSDGEEDFRDFSTHIVKVIDDFIETYAEA